MVQNEAEKKEAKNEAEVVDKRDQRKKKYNDGIFTVRCGWMGQFSVIELQIWLIIMPIG